MCKDNPGSSIRKEIGQMIREARRDAGLTQVQLAELVGTQQGNVARWETGGVDIKLTNLVRIAEACGKKLSIELK